MQKNELTIDQMLDWLYANRDNLSIKTIGKQIGYLNLSMAARRYKRKDGFIEKLPVKYHDKLREVIIKITTIPCESKPSEQTSS